MSHDVHGIARLEDGGVMLTITTKRKRTRTVKKEKVVTYEDHVRKYKIKDVRPDPRVADPAYSLTVQEEVDGEIVDGETYHVGCNEWGVFCQCPDHHYRRQNDQTPCKHCKAMQAVGLLPKMPTTDLPGLPNG